MKTTGSNDQFYTNLPANKIALATLLSDGRKFKAVPEDWHVVITDIKGSTTAVLGGQHEQVNLIATGSIVAVLNIAFSKKVTIPFFFGGDGATFILPPSIIDPVMKALLIYKNNTLSNFNLHLRTGRVSVAEIYSKGHHLNLAKFSSSKIFSIPILLGNGLNYAESLIKGPDYLLADEAVEAEELDLTGMQCRWDRIAPPEEKEEIVTLLVIARTGQQQSDVFRKVMAGIDHIYGPPKKRQPISIAKLKLKTSFNNLGAEMKARMGQVKWLKLIKDWLINLYGVIYFKTESGKTYLKNLVEMSDVLVIDGKINTVISGNALQRAELQKLLDRLERGAEIYYGLHLSNASVMSCYVRDLDEGHIHFVDGSDGGYTQAARMLKAKIANKPR